MVKDTVLKNHKGRCNYKEINRSGGGEALQKQTPFVPPTPTTDFNKIVEQQKAIQQAQQEKNLREYERQKALQEQLLKKINIPTQTITITPPLMSVSKQAEREQQFRNANVFVSSDIDLLFWRLLFILIRGNTTGKQVLQMLLSQKELTQEQDTN